MSRILGLGGSASCIAFVVLNLINYGFPNEPMELWICISMMLTVFNFFNSANFNFANKDSLLGLWIEVQKSKLRKQLD